MHLGVRTYDRLLRLIPELYASPELDVATTEAALDAPDGRRRVQTFAAVLVRVLGRLSRHRAFDDDHANLDRWRDERLRIPPRQQIVFRRTSASENSVSRIEWQPLFGSPAVFVSRRLTFCPDLSVLS